MNPTILGPLALTLVGLSVTLVGESTEHRGLVYLGKPSASLGFILLALGAKALDLPYGRWILAGLALSFLGDVFLMLVGRAWFLSGLVSFLFAHVAYVVAFLVVGVDLAWAALAAGAALGAAWVVMRWLLPNVETGMRVPVLAYVTVISLMACLSVGALGAGNTGLIVGGAGLFYLSDLFVARDRFVREGFVNSLVGLPLYYGGQVLLALSVAVTSG